MSRVENNRGNNDNLNPPQSILKRIVKESLIAFPNDAHHNVLQFLLDSGMDERQALKFRQAWSKVVLGMQAFGRTAKHHIDAELFSNELIHELSFSDEAVLKIIHATEACVKLDHHRDTIDAASKSSKVSSEDSSRNPRDGIVSLDAINHLGQELAQVLADIYKLPSNRNNKGTSENKGSADEDEDRTSSGVGSGMWIKSMLLMLQDYLNQ